MCIPWVLYYKTQCVMFSMPMVTFSSVLTDMVNTVKPDERAVMTYVSSYYHAFTSSQKVCESLRNTTYTVLTDMICKAICSDVRIVPISNKNSCNSCNRHFVSLC